MQSSGGTTRVRAVQHGRFKRHRGKERYAVALSLHPVAAQFVRSCMATGASIRGVPSIKDACIGQVAASKEQGVICFSSGQQAPPSYHFRQNCMV